MHRLNTAPHDAVAELLAALRVRSTVYCLSELREPWGFEVDGANVAKFHLVLAGSCWLNLAGHEPVRLHAGDLVILSRGERHVMSDGPGSPVTNLDVIVAGHPLDPDGRLSGLARKFVGGQVQAVGSLKSRPQAVSRACWQVPMGRPVGKTDSS